MNIRKILAKFSQIPFFRDNGWLFMPLFYLSLIVIVVGIYYSINNSNHYSSYNNGSIDGVLINKTPSIDLSIYKISFEDSSEYITVSNLLGVKDFKLHIRKSKLQDLKNVYSFYSEGSNKKTKAVGYFGYGNLDCKKMRAISLSNLGKHHMVTVDNGISESLSWESDDYNFIFLNKFLSDGIELKSSCTYVVSSK